MTEDIFATIPGVESSKGVALNPPPAAILGDVNRMIIDAMKDLPEDGKGQLVGIANRHANGEIHINLALAIKAHSRVTVVAYMGKTWGKPITAGVMGRISF